MPSAISCSGVVGTNSNKMARQFKKVNATLPWLSKRRIKRFNEGARPAQSPDMNPIQPLWPMIGPKLAGRVSWDVEELWQALQSAMNSIRREEVVTLYRSLSDRMAAVLLATGRHTRSPCHADPCCAPGPLCCWRLRASRRTVISHPWTLATRASQNFPPEASKNFPPTLYKPHFCFVGFLFTLTSGLRSMEERGNATVAEFSV